LRYNLGVSATGEAGQRPSKLGRYELITRIGQGGMAEVQLALQRGPAGFEKLVVVKLVHENLATQKAFVDMLLDEARVAALVKHPNVVDIYDLGQAEGRYFIAMEYLEGEPLLAVLRAGREGKRLDTLSTARLIADTAEGLDAAHELRSMAGDALELVHHDISLGNIVVLYNGQVKLVDFGVAKASQSASTRTKVQGKFSYMAPEKLKGAPGDRRSDIFSLGCVLWEALTLKRLYKGGNDAETMKQVLELEVMAPSEVNGDVIADFDPIVMKALAQDPAKRYATAKELAADLEEVLRKQGYAAKNDLIARYMQETFSSHIAARKKLLQEVSSKGGASAEVLEAAFNDAVVANGSPITPMSAPNEFSVRFRRSELPPPLRKSEPKLAASSGVHAVPLPPQADLVEEWVQKNRGEPDPGETEVEITKVPESRSKRTLLLVVGGAIALAAIVIVAVKLLGGGSDSKPAESPPMDEATAPPVPADVAPSVAPEQPTTQAPAPPPSNEIEMNPATAKDKQVVKVVPKHPTAKETKQTHPNHVETPHPKDPPPPPPEKPDLDALVNAGVNALVRGDTKSALAAYQHAKATNPSYPAVWRGLGVVYEKMGDSKQAKAAFQRYLQLAPNAGDAAQIRARMDKLAP
jgi:eukaryotic-like serine/threonine-protein kinase